MTDFSPRRHSTAPIDREDLVAGLGKDGVTRPLAVGMLRASRAVSVRDLGAVGDGMSHPLSERYRTLADAKRDFPRAESLRDEVDWAATQAAIDLVAAAGGGTVVSPAGTYRCNRTISFPECREFGVRGVEVNWLGEGKFATEYRWADDLGEGSFAVLCPKRYEPDGMYEGVWQDIGLVGPGRAAPAPGMSPAMMSGWGWGSRRRMVRCAASRFRAGLNIVGDHSRFEDVVSRENLYAVYFDRASEHLYGDLLFEKCMFSGCGMAAVAVHPATQMGGCTMVSCYVGGSPYSIMKEAGRGEDAMISNSVFLNCMFEYAGNAWLHDANEPRRAIVRKATFDTCYFQWADVSRWTRAPRNAVWDIHRTEHVRWLQPKEPYALVPGDQALIKVRSAEACEITGHTSHLAENCAQEGRPFLHPDAARDDGFRGWGLTEPGGWAGRFALLAPDSPAVERGDVLEWAPAGRVRRGTRSPTPFAGVCLMGAGPGGFTVAATSGPALEVRSPAGRADVLLVKGPDGSAEPAPAQGAARNVVGWAFFSQRGRAFVDVGGPSA